MIFPSNINEMNKPIFIPINKLERDWHLIQTTVNSSYEGRIVLTSIQYLRIVERCVFAHLILSWTKLLREPCGATRLRYPKRH